MGGGNLSILKMLEHSGIHPEVFVAHDLDHENKELLANRRLDFVLHHNMQQDITNAFNAFLAFHRLVKEAPESKPSTVQVLTPENIPL